MRYSTACCHFFAFCEAKNIPRDIFERNAATIALVTKCFAMHLRDAITGRTRDHLGNRLPPTAAYITSTVSGVKSFVEKYDAAAAAHMRSPDLSRVIAGLGKRDKISRGPRDTWCNITLGAEFVERLLAHVDTALYADNPYMRILMRAGILMEYCWGVRVYEGLVQPTSQPKSDLYCENDPEVTIDTAAADVAACCHTITADMVALRYGNAFVPFHVATTPGWTPPGNARPDLVTLHLASSKNHPDGEPPRAIYPNTHPTGAVQYCLVDAMLALAAHSRPHPMGARAHVLHGLPAPALRAAIKTVAANAGLAPHRCHIRGLRIGCCSATTPKVLDLAGALQQSVRNTAQAWGSETGSNPYSHGQLDAGMLKSMQLYDRSISSIAETVYRFMPRA